MKNKREKGERAREPEIEKETKRDEYSTNRRNMA